MQVEAKLIEIPNNGNPSTEYIEKELNNLGITPLRWAIVKVQKKTYTLSVADLMC